MRALAIDTSSHRAGVALRQDGETVAYEQNDEPALHAERLVTLVERAFARAGWRRGEIDLVAACVGPGSFTGIRVGLATAKGIALGLDKPLVGVESLEAMAAPARSEQVEVIVPLLDARKNELFWAAYSRAGERILGPGHVARGDIAEALAPLLSRGIVVVGEVAADLSLPAARIVRGELTDLPHAAEVARVALERFAKSGPGDLDALEPVYVRPPDITTPKAG
jgi:tRNA threonylcarbamoyladenosine biosynthesis protein TsaB